MNSKLFILNKINNKFAFLYLILTCNLLNIQAQTLSQSNGLQLIVQKAVVPYFKQPNTHALAIAIIDSSNFYTYYFGELDKDNPNLPDSNTIFSIGSISKVFTASILSSLIEEKIIELNDTITKFLPDSLSQLNPNLKKITIKQLATHTSGLPKEPYNLQLNSEDKTNPYSNYTIKNLFEFLVKFKKTNTNTNKKNNTFLYSHTGYGLLGHILEFATKKSYADLLQQYIKKTLQINNISIPLNNNKTVKGHLFSGESTLPRNFNTMYGSEGLCSDLNSLVKFVYANLDTSNHLYPIFNKCHTPIEKALPNNVLIGLGWYILKLSNNKKQPSIITHSGRSGGYSNYLGFVKKSKTAVIILSNSSLAVDEIGIELIKVLNR